MIPFGFKGGEKGLVGGLEHCGTFWFQNNTLLSVKMSKGGREGFEYLWHFWDQNHNKKPKKYARGRLSWVA